VALSASTGRAAHLDRSWVVEASAGTGKTTALVNRMVDAIVAGTPVDAMVQADLEEAVRIAYVAATRARDLLVVAAIGEEERQGRWLSPLHDALYPPKERWRTAGKAPGCPKFGDATVLNRPPDQPEEVSVKPGLHYPKRGSHEVVWFDPAVLNLRVARTAGVGNEQVLAGTPEQAAEGLRRYREWKRRRTEASSRAACRGIDSRPPRPSGRPRRRSRSPSRPSRCRQRRGDPPAKSSAAWWTISCNTPNRSRRPTRWLLSGDAGMGPRRRSGTPRRWRLARPCSIRHSKCRREPCAIASFP